MFFIDYYIIYIEAFIFIKICIPEQGNMLPCSEKLINLKLITRKKMFMHNWKDCLAEYSKFFLKEL